jgi:predicted outer membrane protein
MSTRYQTAGSFAVAVLLGLGITAYAQNQRAPGGANQRTDGVRAQNQTQPGRAEISQSERLIVDWVALGNCGEIGLSRIAEERAQHDSVKKFASQMVQDHSKFLQQLDRFTGKTAADRTNGRGSERAVQGTERGAAKNETGNERPIAQHESLTGFDVLRLKEMIGQRCLARAERELKESQKDDFDKCYIGMQLGLHADMLATLEVFQGQTSGELQLLLTQGLSTTEEHFQMAKKLIDQLEGRPAATSARRDRSQSE